MTASSAVAGAALERLPTSLRGFLERGLPLLTADSRVIGVAAGGSVATGGTDEFSDLDLVIAVDPGAYPGVLAERRAIAEGLGQLLAAFTGEHVGETRLLICLYDEPLLHVDLKFVALEDAAERVEDPIVLFERDGRLSAVLAGGVARFPQPDLQWIEDRFWTWLHYLTLKLLRGELFDVLEGLGFLRARVLGPLVLLRAGARPSGVRRIEFAAPDAVPELARTVAAYDHGSAHAALSAVVVMYRRLRDELATPGLKRGSAAEAAAYELFVKSTP